MKKVFGFFAYCVLLTIICLMSFFVASCSTPKICKHQILLPVTFQTDSSVFYTVYVPFCDTVIVNNKKKKNGN